MLSKLETAKKILGRMSIGERVLLACSTDPGKIEKIGSHEKPGDQWTIENALDPLFPVFPDLKNLIKNKRVLDYGCGDGFQSVALAQAGAGYVLGVEIEVKRLQFARGLATASGLRNVDFQERIAGKFDIAISLNAMEHFVDPAANLHELRDALAEDGKLLIMFGPPWYAPFGNHMYFFCSLPWINLIFSERSVMRIRSLYRSDGMMSYSPGLNKMSIGKCERLIRDVGFRIEKRQYHCIKRLNFLANIPVIREMFINQVAMTLTR